MHFQPVPKFGPKVQTKTVAKHLTRFQSIFGLDVRVIKVGIKPQIEHPVRTIHHVELTTRIIRPAYIDWPAERNHPAIMLMVSRISYLVDFVLFSLVITRQTDRTKIVPILRPTRLYVMGENLFQLRIARSIGFLIEFDKWTQLLCVRILDSQRITQLEVVHRLGVIRQMQRWQRIEIISCRIIFWSIGIDYTRPIIPQT